MDELYVIFLTVAGIAGALALIAFALWALGWAAVQVFKWLKVWHVICLAISIRLHGKDYADNQFWWAIAEHAGRSNASARIIAEYAMKHQRTPSPGAAGGGR